jgi:DNA-binding transcriptional MerR regulator
MLKIGEFAQLSQVTVKTLHHYSDIGLFEPAHIDPKNNYRYYKVDQLPRIHRIMAMKEVGLSLDQIRLLMTEDLPIEQFRGMLRLKQSEIEQEIKKAQQKSSIVDFRLRMIEAETNFPNMDVVIKELEPLFVLSMVVKQHHTMKNVTETLHRAIKDGAVKYAGVSVDVFHGETIIHLESPELQEGQHEILLLVESSQQDVVIPELGELRTRTEPGSPVAATLMLNGETQGTHLDQVTLLQRWAVAHGYGLNGQVRYWMHRGPLETLNREDFVVEVQLPLTASD